MTANRLLAATVVASAFLPNVVVANRLPGAASDWLEQMNLAVRTLNYEGRFVYQYGMHLETLFLRHVVTDQGEFESLRTLNGQRREVFRDNDHVTCLLPGHDNVDVARGKTGSGFSPLLPVHSEALTDYYEFLLGTYTRVAGRRAQEVYIKPRDALRYGYRLALDIKDALPLRTETRDVKGRLISRTMFTDLTVGIEVAKQEKKDRTLSDHLRAVRKGVMPKKESAGGRGLHSPGWRFARTPPGFKLDVHRRHAEGDSGAIVEHFIFSDGLATVSVYVEPDQPNALIGPVQMGPVNAFGLRVNGHAVTAVGEVPAITVQSFGRALVASSSDER